MGADIALFLDPERQAKLPFVFLGEVIAPESPEDLVEGQSVCVYGTNIGSHLRDLSLYLLGQGAPNVQLAQNQEGEPGVWAAPGQSIVIAPGTLARFDTFEFWARGIYTPADVEGRKPLMLNFRAVSLG